MNEKWDAYFLQSAKLASKLSKDPSTKVGAAIANQKYPVSTGYNGFPKGVADNTSRLTNRETKLKLTEHAERNALSQAAENGANLKNCTIYSTYFTCINCAKGIINSGITRLVYIKQPAFEQRWDLSEVFEIYREVGIECKGYTMEELAKISKDYDFNLD